MMLVNAKDLLNKAKIEKYAVAHLNINNLEWAKYILEETQSLNSPIILGVSLGAVKYMGGFNVVRSIVSSLIRDLNITIPVVLHLDHGTSFEACKSAIDAGFTSVMIDASKLSIEENIKVTKQVVDYAKQFDVSVESEVGAIGGDEDGVANELAYAKLEHCIRIARETNIDFLAPALGSVHGLYKGEPKLDFEKMMEVNNEVNIPLVLHGGTGINDELIKKAISCGITKINVNTELQIEWTKGVRQFIATDSSQYDPRHIIGSGEENVKTAIRKKILLFGSNNKA
ncbi:MAG: class II fructose-1,6-bisphosphate aldolase [Mycoplasmatota bacterium]